MSIPVKDLAYFDDKAHDWVVGSDKFALSCGVSFTDIKSTITVLVK
ncbi:MAG: hypothetical protein E6772_16195 [Dysgonomonas sp.]|nr:hypothetical protein [Dysgonomonas sp.]